MLLTVRSGEMQRAQTATRNARDTNAKTAELVKLISEIGPNIPEIARRTGQFKESVRYRYKEKVLGKGFGVHALVDNQKLGLKRVLLIVEFAPDYRIYANAIMAAMNELCYVVYFEKRLLTDDYMITSSVPDEFVASFVEFASTLRDMGIFRTLEVIKFDWFRTIPMRAEYFDFDTGRWDFDWSSTEVNPSEASYTPAERIKFDYMDLLILKELQLDATRSFAEICSKLRVNYKVLAWHHKTHVLNRGMVDGYYLRWMGTSYDNRLERALHKKHRYQQMGVLARELSSNERMELMAKVHALPYLWSEMIGDRDYYAEFFFSTEDITEALQFLTKAISPFKNRAKVMMLDQSEALSFTFSYQLFDKERREWTFDLEQLTKRFENLSTQIKEAGRP